MKEKIVLIESDYHAAHLSGLTHPRYQIKEDDKHSYRRKFGEMQKVMFNWRKKELGKLGPVDVHIINGDVLEGAAELNKGIELITSDLNLQIDMACDIIPIAKLKKKGQRYMTFGTPYHGTRYDLERQVAKRLECDIDDTQELEINGLKINCRHKIGNTSLPHTRHTALLRENLWNMVKAEKGLSQDADVFIFSHRHFCSDCSGILPWQRAFVTPCLQGGTSFGSRQCSSAIDIGFLVLKIRSQHDWDFKQVLQPLEFLAPEVKVIKG